MTANEDIELLRWLYDAWNAKDFEAARPYIDPDIVWRPSGRFPGFEPVYHGPEGVRDFWQTMNFDAIGKESGVRVELPVAHVWRVSDGQVVSYSAHTTFDEALAEARAPS